ncbi:MAG: hypothetical protein LBL61_01420, partial [Elusimicrobiota bacterium]|nr:hypothetical protein [Elusimicrobiota bacterium]
ATIDKSLGASENDILLITHNEDGSYKLSIKAQNGEIPIDIDNISIDIGIPKATIASMLKYVQILPDITIITSKNKIPPLFHLMANSLTGLFKTLAGVMAPILIVTNNVEEAIKLVLFAGISYAMSLFAKQINQLYDNWGEKKSINIGLLANILGITMFMVPYISGKIVNEIIFGGLSSDEWYDWMLKIGGSILIGFGAVLNAQTSKMGISKHSATKSARNANNAKLNTYKLWGSLAPAIATLTFAGLTAGAAHIFSWSLNGKNPVSDTAIVGTFLTMLFWSVSTLFMANKAGYKNDISSKKAEKILEQAFSNVKKIKSNVIKAILTVGAQITGDILGANILKEQFIKLVQKYPIVEKLLPESFLTDDTLKALSVIATIAFLNVPSIVTTSIVSKWLKKNKFSNEQMNPVFSIMGIAGYATVIGAAFVNPSPIIIPFVMIAAGLLIATLGLSNSQAGFINIAENALFKAAKEKHASQGQTIDIPGLYKDDVAKWNGYVKGLVPLTILALIAFISQTGLSVKDPLVYFVPLLGVTIALIGESMWKAISDRSPARIEENIKKGFMDLGLTEEEAQALTNGSTDPDLIDKLNAGVVKNMVEELGISEKEAWNIINGKNLKGKSSFKKALSKFNKFLDKHSPEQLKQNVMESVMEYGLTKEEAEIFANGTPDEAIMNKISFGIMTKKSGIPEDKAWDIINGTTD